MVLADRRFAKKRTQLPKWIASALSDADANLSVDQAVAGAKKFLKTMSKPFPARMQDGISTWNLEELQRHKSKMEAEREREDRINGAQQDGEGADGHVHGDQVMREAEEEEYGMLEDNDLMDL